MLNAGVLSFDGTGRIRNRSAGVPTDFNGGTPMLVVGGVSLLCHNSLAIDAYAQGTGFVGLLLAVDTVGPVAKFTQGGLGLNATNQVAADLVGAITGYNAGLPITAANKLAFAASE